MGIMNIVVNDFSDFLELSLACLVIMIPFIIGIFIYKRYNIFHGIVSYFFFNYILCFIFNELLTTINIFTENQSLLVVEATETQYNFIYESILLIPNFKENFISNEKYIVLTIVFLIYLLLHMTFMAIDRVKN